VTNVGDDPQVAKFEREAERNRAELSQTVGNLRDKITETVSPAAVKQEVKDYVQQSGEQLIETLRRKAYENPLQAVAVAAGLGYPLWRVVANMPLPVLMVGAGIALARPGSQTPAGGVLDAGMERVKNRARGATSTVQDAAASASDAVASAASQLGSSVTSAAEGARSSIGEAAASTVEAAQTSANEILNAVDRYPLIVGGIGLAIGALIGTAIPRTSAETEMVGELSGEVQGRAREMMKTGADAVQKVASEVYDEAAQEADKQGLTGQKMRDGALDLQDQVLGKSDAPRKGSRT